VTTSGRPYPGRDAIAFSRLMNSDIASLTATRGDLITGGASDWQNLAIGTSGYHLQSDGTDAGWAGFTQAGTGATTRTWQDKARTEVHVEDFGAVGDADAGGTTGTDDTAAFQRAIDYVKSRDSGAGIGGGIVHFGRKRYLIDGALTIYPNVTLRGPIEMPGLVLGVGTTGVSYDNLAGVLYVNSSQTITMQWSAGLQNCYVVRKGLVTPFADNAACTAGIAAFAGTAITNLLILGFAQAVSIGSAASRARCDYVAFDCTAGILVDGSADVAHFNHCHGWPYLTTTVSGVSDTNLTRTGTAYEFRDTEDWGVLNHCFSFGYAVGFDLNGAGIGRALGCGADYPGAISSTSIGFRVRGTDPRQASFALCVAGGQGTAYYIDNSLSSSTGGAVTLLGCRAFATDTTGLHIVSGRVIASQCVFRSGTTGILADSTAGALTITGCEFEDLTTPLNIDATPLASSQIYGNRSRNCTNPISNERMTIEGVLQVEAPDHPAHFINTADSASVQVGHFGGDRANPANNDSAYFTYELSNAAGTQVEAFRQTWRLTDVSTGSEDSQVFWGVMVSGSQTNRLILTGTVFAPTSNAALALGSGSLGWNGAFLSTGTAINWANGDVTLTHGSTNLVTLAGGDLAIGASALSTSAVDGLIYIPSSTSSSTSAPIGTPTGRTGTVPMVYATGSNRLWIYNGAWRSVVLSS
jgi:hypothetical protein